MARSTKVVTFDTDPAGPGPAVAASLALPLLRKAKVDTWAELLGALASGDERVLGVVGRVHLSAEQLRVLDEYPGVLSVVRLNPSVSVAVCPVCSEWFAVDGSAPARCPMTFGCVGKPVKAAAAKQVVVDAADLAGSGLVDDPTGEVPDGDDPADDDGAVDGDGDDPDELEDFAF